MKQTTVLANSVSKSATTSAASSGDGALRRLVGGKVTASQPRMRDPTGEETSPATWALLSELGLLCA